MPEFVDDERTIDLQRLRNEVAAGLSPTVTIERAVMVRLMNMCLALREQRDALIERLEQSEDAA